MIAALLGGMSSRQSLSSGMGALAADAEGVLFNGSWVVSSGNIAANMYSNVMLKLRAACLPAGCTP